MFREVFRDKRQIMTMEQNEEILTKAKAGVLSVHGDDGYPYGVPLNFVYANNKLYFHCMPEHGHKLDAIKRDPKVSFSIIYKDDVVKEEYTSYFQSVIVFGRARIVEDVEEKIAMHEILVKKYMPELWEGCYEIFKDRIAWMGVIEVEIDHISGKQAIELAVPGFVLEELRK